MQLARDERTAREEGWMKKGRDFRGTRMARAAKGGKKKGRILQCLRLVPIAGALAAIATHGKGAEVAALSQPDALGGSSA